jgi:hypothetical protein
VTASFSIQRETKMNCKPSLSISLWARIVLAVVVISSTAALGFGGYKRWEYLCWRDKVIAWDFGTIERLCGGETEEERLLDIEFLKEWEYKALKKTRDGKQVWIHWKLSKRHCGNWMLVDWSQMALIGPIEVRFPNGPPRRHGFDCLGQPVYR